MPVITDTPPEPTDLESATVTLDRWGVGESATQNLIADSILTSWAAHELPSGLDRVAAFTSSKGDTVLSYQQWSDPAAQEEWHRHPSRRDGDITPAEHLDTRHFSHHHSFLHRRAAPSCLVLVTFDFETDGQALQWTDLLVDAIAGDKTPTPGCVSRHLLLGRDGRSVLNYSLWVNEDDHRRSLEAPATNPAWQRIEGFPGLTHGPGARCRLHGTVEGLTTPPKHVT